MSIFFHDEDDVALVAVGGAGEFSEIHAADPVVGDLEGDGFFPLAFSDAVGAGFGSGLRGDGEVGDLVDVATAVSGVVAHAVEIDGDFGGGIGAQEDIEGLAGGDAGFGAVAFDEERAILEGAGAADVGELPGGGAGLLVFELDFIEGSRGLGGVDEAGEEAACGEAFEEVAAGEFGLGVLVGGVHRGFPGCLGHLSRRVD